MFQRFASLFYSPEQAPLFNPGDRNSELTAVLVEQEPIKKDLQFFSKQDLSKKINACRQLLEQLPLFTEVQKKRTQYLAALQVGLTFSAVCATFGAMYAFSDRKIALAQPLIAILQPVLNYAVDQFQTFKNKIGNVIGYCNIDKWWRVHHDAYFLDRKWYQEEHTCYPEQPVFTEKNRIHVAGFNGGRGSLTYNFCDVKVTENSSEECKAMLKDLCEITNEFLSCYQDTIAEYYQKEEEVNRYQNEMQDLKNPVEPIRACHQLG